MATAKTRQSTPEFRANGIGKRLLQDKLITQEVYSDSNAAARKAKQSLVDYLVENGIVAENDIAYAASQEFGMPMFDLAALNLDLEIVSLVTGLLMEKHHFLPLLKRDKKLFIGVTDPIAFQGMDEVKFHTSLLIEPIVVESNKLSAKIKEALSKMDDSLDEFGSGDVDLEKIELEDTETDDVGVSSVDIDDAPVVRFVNKMLLDAIKSGASDVHFEPYEKAYRVRYRQDGMLREVTRPPVGLSGKLAARLKVMSRMDIAERRVPQDVVSN